MSIITDALRKAELEKQKKSSVNEEEIAKSFKAPSLEKSRDLSGTRHTPSSRFPIKMLLLWGAAALLLLGFVFFILRNGNNSVSDQPIIKTSTDRSAADMTPAAPKPRPAAKTGNASFILTGIVWDSVKPSAIINDEIVETGSKIAGASVLEIRPHEVILEQNGEKHRLML